ncbi:hypothetical protein D3C80_1829110 [compost metagenome]
MRNKSASSRRWAAMDAAWVSVHRRISNICTRSGLRPFLLGKRNTVPLGFWEMYEPSPRRLIRMPSALSCATASRTTERLTFNCSVSCCSVGSRDSAVRRPESISSRMALTTRSTRESGR